MNQRPESQENSVLSGVKYIHVFDDSRVTCVVFNNGAAIFSDRPDTGDFYNVATPNLRVIDYTNWVYRVTQGF
jgi:hypothetical protein